MAYLEVRDLSVSYGDSFALSKVSVSVEQGDLFAILGPSGSGKTTLLLTIAGFLRPKAGRIILDGRDITADQPQNRGIGMVFQSGALFPHLRVFENVAYPLRARHVNHSEIVSRVAEVLKIVQLEGLEKRLPRQLSGGQQQRVALARALVFSPRLLLFDEPLGSLDKKLREDLQYSIRRIQRERGHTILYVTHDQGEAISISDRLAVLREGIVVQVASPREIYENPATAFIADFVGGANFLAISIAAINEHTCTVSLSDFPISEIPMPAWTPSVGKRAILMIRPEHLRVHQDKQGQGNSIPCEVRDILFQGMGINVRCALPNGSIVSIWQPASEWTVRPGMPLHLSLLASNARLYQSLSDEEE